MKNEKRNMLICYFCGLALTLVGCVPCLQQKEDLIARGTVRLDLEPREDMPFKIKANECGGSLLVSGTREFDVKPLRRTDDVLIKVIGPGGRVLAQKKAMIKTQSYLWKGHYQSSFETEFGFVPDQGNLIRVSEISTK